MRKDNFYEENALSSHRTLFLHLFKLAMSTPVAENSIPEDRDGNMEDSAKEAVYEETVSAPQAYVIRTTGNTRAYITVLVLFVINLLNYMDRQTIAGRKNLYTTQPRYCLSFELWALILRTTKDTVLWRPHKYFLHFLSVIILEVMYCICFLQIMANKVSLLCA